MPEILGIFDGILGIIGRFLEILVVFWVDYISGIKHTTQFWWGGQMEIWICLS
jgi:hypothetical protein